MAQQSKLTVKQERENRRAEKVEAFRKQQQKERRTRRIALISSLVGGVTVIALIVWGVVASTPEPLPDVDAQDIAGLETFPGVSGGVHIDPTPVDYESQYGTVAPAGGDHWAAWLNCGIYEEPQQNENAVHSLEHGAVWVTYDPSALDQSQIDSLVSQLPDTYVIVSPYPGLPAPVVASAWGAQVQLDGVDDERLREFVSVFWKAATAPEPGASCMGAIDGPGRVA